MKDEECHDTSELDSLASSGDYYNATKRRHKFSTESVEALRNITIEKIYETDNNVKRAIEMFLSNRVVDAEKIFEEGMYLDPIYASGNACLASIKALLSMNQTDVKVALEHISHAVHFADAVENSNTGIVAKIGGKIAGIFKNDHKECLPGVFRARVILAEAYALRGFLLLQQSSISSLVKGGLALRDCYNLLHGMYNNIMHRKKVSGSTNYDGIGVDLNSVYGVFMALGSVHIVLSIPPPHIIRLLDSLGFTHDREKGVLLLNESIESNTLFSPVSELFAAVLNIFLGGFNKLLATKTALVARNIYARSSNKELFDNSMLHLWLKARLERIELKTDLGISILSECLENVERSQIARAMPQLIDFARYDQAWNYCVGQRWPEAITYFRCLEENSPWSRIFYAYAQGCCYEMMVIEADDDEAELDQWRQEASRAYWRAAHFGKTVIGGRTLSVEDFLTSRLEEIHYAAGVRYPNSGNKKTITPETTDPYAQLGNPVKLAAVELMVIFDKLHHVPPEFMRIFIDCIDKALALEADRVEDAGTRAFLQLLGFPLNKIIHNEEKNGHRVTTKLDKTESNNAVILVTLKAVVLSYLDEVRSRELIQTLHGFLSKHKISKKTSATWVVPMLYYTEAYLSAVKCDNKMTTKCLEKSNEASHESFVRIMGEKAHFIRRSNHKLGKPLTISSEKNTHRKPNILKLGHCE